MGPTLAGFIEFVYGVMGITIAVLPNTAPVIQYAYQIALDVANQQLCVVPSSSASYPSVYALAVYNLAGDLLVNYAPDVPDAPPVTGGSLPFFANLRNQLGINSFVGGVIQSSSDEGTSEAMVVPEQMKELTFQNLQQLKTPWGRRYLGLAQSVGTNWGLS